MQPCSALRRAALSFVLFTSMLCASGAHSAYTITDLGDLGGGALFGYQTTASGINENGQVVGASLTTSGAIHSFITGPNGVGMTDLGTLGGFNSYAAAINASGQVVGLSDTTGGVNHAFITGPNGQGMSDLGTLGGTQSQAFGINASGQVVGDATLPGNTAQHAFITGPNGVGITDLGTLGGMNSYAYGGINDIGQVAGTSNTNDSSRAFITGPNGVGMIELGTLGVNIPSGSNGHGINASGQVTGSSDSRAFITGPNGIGMTDLGTLDGFSYSMGLGINSSGQVVGSAFTNDWTLQHAFITGPNGQGMIDLNSLLSLEGGTYFVQSHGVNDRGQIIANASNGHAYLLSPVPEPETYAMMMAGLGLLGFVARRKNRI